MTTATPPRPAPPAVPPRLTPDDLLNMPDEGKGYELIDGILREKPMSARSSRVGVRVVRFLEVYCERPAPPGWVFASDAGFQCFTKHPGRVRRADVALIAFDRMSLEQYEEEGFIKIVPDLVVEVVSPSNSAEDVDEKTVEWLRAGVKEVWVLYPKTGHFYAYRPGGGFAFLRDGDTLTSPVLPGFSVSVAELFWVPAPPPQDPAAGGE